MTLSLYRSPEIAEAQASGDAIVALESTIITHGMPYPQNVETARMVEAEIRAEGAIPATIAVMGGKLTVGLGEGELDALGRAQDVMKLSRADFAIAMATGRTGSTTVAATMIAAHLAEIEVFATGGIGGVHRGAELSFDISADLRELAETPVNVISAGAKAILDLPKTLETLETLGVPVITMGADQFPAFWSRGSGLATPARLDRIEDVAAAFRMRQRLGLPGGQLVACPIPKEEEIPQETLTPLIETAIAEAETRGILGKDVTPFLLRRIVELTDGQSLKSNIALIRNNARIAARLARALVETPKD